MAPGGGWLSTKQASVRLGVTLRSLYRFIDAGDLAAYKFGRVIRLKEDDVDRFIESCRIAPGDLEHLYPPQGGGRRGGRAGHRQASGRLPVLRHRGRRRPGRHRPDRRAHRGLPRHQPAGPGARAGGARRHIVNASWSTPTTPRTWRRCSPRPARWPGLRVSPAKTAATGWCSTWVPMRSTRCPISTCTSSAGAGRVTWRLRPSGRPVPATGGGPMETMVPHNHLMAGLLGQRDELLRLVEGAFDDVRIAVQGNLITVEGSEAERVARLFDELVLVLESGQGLDATKVARTIDMAREDLRPSEVLSAEVVRSARGRTVRPRTAGQKRYTDAIAENVITFGIGPAGTGKSYLAVALAVQALQARQVNRIILTRPAVEAGERLGFLPGDLMAKVDPYLRPLYDALYDLLEPENAQRLLERGTVEVAPLAFMRGRTLNNSFIILDEAQNTTPEQMKMFLTRIGFGSKCVVTGDVTQIDVQGGRSGLLGLEPVLGAVEDITFVHLTRRDVVRHKIVADIIDAYERRRGPAGRSGDPMALDVYAADEQSDHPVAVERWAGLARSVLADRRDRRCDAEVSLLFVDEAAIAALNERFLDAGGPTDVLAFPIEDEVDRSGRSPDEGGTGPGSVEPDDEPPGPARRRGGLPRGGRRQRRRPRGHLRRRDRPARRPWDPPPARDGPRRRRGGRAHGAARATAPRPLPPAVTWRPTRRRDGAGVIAAAGFRPVDGRWSRSSWCCWRRLGGPGPGRDQPGADEQGEGQGPGSTRAGGGRGRWCGWSSTPSASSTRCSCWCSSVSWSRPP